jgi:hypothetical protein
MIWLSIAHLFPKDFPAGTVINLHDFPGMRPAKTIMSAVDGAMSIRGPLLVGRVLYGFFPIDRLPGLG